VCEKSITNSQPFVKKNEKMSCPLGGGLTHTVHRVACDRDLPGNGEPKEEEYLEILPFGS